MSDIQRAFGNRRPSIFRLPGDDGDRD
jgi:hypothetical protein